MNYRSLGRSDIKVSTIGMGCWAIGGTKWGPTDDRQSIKALQKAQELGVNFFDTADFYGLGHSEELLGQAFKPNDDDVIIATKVGLRWNNKGKIFHDLSPAYIKKACEASLRRLNRQTIDLHQIHWPDPNTDFSESLKAIDGLVKQGKVRYAGACNLSLEQLKQIKAYPWFVSYQDKFNLFQQQVKEELLPYCQANNIAFIGYGPLFKGILTGKFTEKPKFAKGDHRRYKKRFSTRFGYYQKKVDELRQQAARHNITVAQLALASLLEERGVTAVIPGAKTAKQVEENVQASLIEIN